MSGIDLDTLIAPITSDDVFDKIVDVLERMDLPAKKWRPGGVGKTIIGALAEVGYQGSSIARELIRGMFLTLARGAYLSAHAEDVFDVIRRPATAAAGTVTLTNDGGASYTIGANELVVRASSTGARFRVEDAFVLGPNTSIDVTASAIEPGAASSVSPGDIDELETPLTRVTVTNAAALVGTDAEDDDALVRRAKAKRGTWSPFGPRDAYEYAALSATLPDGSPTSITRVTTSRASTTGTVTVTVATPSGTPTTPELDAVVEAVNAMARSDTATAIVQGATPVPTSHTITLWCRGGVATTIEQRAAAALTKLIANYPIGGISKTTGGQGYLYLDAIAAAVIGSSPEAFDADFQLGATDTPLDPDEVATNTSTFDVRIL